MQYETLVSGYATVQELLEKFEGHKGIRIPDYQRSDTAWRKNPTGRHHLIRDVLLGRAITMPLSFEGALNNNPYLVDGQQRLTALLAYRNDVFSLNIDPDEIPNLKNCAGKRYSQLTKSEQDYFNNYKFRYEVIPDGKGRETFERINNNGVPLSRAERSAFEMSETEAYRLNKQLQEIVGQYWPKKDWEVYKANAKATQYVNYLLAGINASSVPNTGVISSPETKNRILYFNRDEDAIMDLVPKKNPARKGKILGKLNYFASQQLNTYGVVEFEQIKTQFENLLEVLDYLYTKNSVKNKTDSDEPTAKFVGMFSDVQSPTSIVKEGAVVTRAAALTILSKNINKPIRYLATPQIKEALILAEIDDKDSKMTSSGELTRRVNKLINSVEDSLTRPNKLRNTK